MAFREVGFLHHFPTFSLFSETFKYFYIYNISIMGKARYIYFSDEVDEKIQDIPNRSKLICELLLEHFKKVDFKQLTPQELKKAIEIEELKQDFETKLKELQNE